MSAIGLWASKAMLDFILGGASPSPPAGVWCGVAVAAPTSVSANEIGAGSGYSRATAQFGAALTPAGSGSASNSASMSFGPFSSSQAITGLFLQDNSTIGNQTNMLWFGTFNTARTPLPGDTMVIPAGALQISLA